MSGTIIMIKGAPPSSVCFSLDDLNHEDDDRSELTGPYYGDDFSQEDDFGAKLAADPYYYHTLDGSHHSRAEKQGQLDLKLKIVRQQEKLDILSSKLSQYEVENEALKAEKAALVDELAHARGATQEQPTTRQGWFSKGANGNGGSMQLLVDTNSKLMLDNARLQVVVEVTRRSFQSYIKDSRRDSDKDKQTLETLLKLSLSEHTAKTSLESSFTEENQEDLPIDSSQHSTQDSMPRNSLHSISEREFKFGTSGDDWITEGEEIEETKIGLISERAARRNPMEFIWSKETKNAFANRAARRNSLDLPITSKETKSTFVKGVARRKSADLLVEFGVTKIRRPRSQSENLLVDFGGTRRARSAARTRSSLKL